MSSSPIIEKSLATPPHHSFGHHWLRHGRGGFEGLTLGRGRRAIQSLLDFLPRTVSVLRNDHVVEVPAHQVQVGDTVIVIGQVTICRGCCCAASLGLRGVFVDRPYDDSPQYVVSVPSRSRHLKLQTSGPS
jgi:hypothetical protein